MLASIKYASYILIALHFLRMVLHRVTPAYTQGIHPEFHAPEGYNYKVVIFYRTADGTLRAMEYYTESLSECNDLFYGIRTYISRIPEKTLFYFYAHMNLQLAFKTNMIDFPTIDSLLKFTPTLTFRQRMAIESEVYDIHNRCHLGSYYRNIIIC